VVELVELTVLTPRLTKLLYAHHCISAHSHAERGVQDMSWTPTHARRGNAAETLRVERGNASRKLFRMLE